MIRRYFYDVFSGAFSFLLCPKSKVDEPSSEDLNKTWSVGKVESRYNKLTVNGAKQMIAHE